MKYLILILLLSSSCASTKIQKRKDAKHFPTRLEITELIKEKQTDILKGRTPGKVVDTWELKEPLPTMIGETIASPKNDVEKVLAEAIKQLPDMKMTDSMNCVAHQQAEFRSVHAEAPFDSLTRFINARCGSYTNSSKIHSTQSAKSLSKEKLQKILETIFKKEKGEITNIGVHLAEGDTKSTLTFAYEKSMHHVEPIPMLAEEGGTFRFEGTYNGEDVKHFSAKFNVGDFGFGRCERQPVEPPAFSFICKTNVADPFSYLELASTQKDAKYYTAQTKFMIFPKQLTNIYTAPKSRRILRAAAQKVKEGDLAYLEELINRVRNSGGRRAVKLERAQSQIIQKLTPLYVNSESDVGKKNRIILSMLAGWEVEGEIVNASFKTGYVDGSDTISMLESVLESPAGRKILLAKNVSSFGVGIVSKPQKGSHYIFVSYNFLQDEHMNKRISRVVESLRKERKIRKLRPPKELTQYRTNAVEWAKQFDEGATFESIKNKMVNTFRHDYGSNKQLWICGYTISNLDSVHFLEDILNAKELEIMIFVTPYRPKNSPRTFFAIFYISGIN